MQYGMNALQKQEDDLSFNGASPSMDFESGIMGMTKMCVEQDELLENTGAYLTTVDQLENIKAEAKENLGKEGIDYEVESMKLERDINSSLALIGGSFMSGRYGRSVLNPKTENDILKAKGKQSYILKMEGVSDFIKTIWEKIKAFFQRIWDFFFGREKKREEALKEVEQKIQEVLEVDVQALIEQSRKEMEEAGERAVKDIEEQNKKRNEKLAKHGVGLMLKLGHISKVKDVFDTTIAYAESVEKHYNLESTSLEFAKSIWEDVTKSKYVDAQELVSGQKGRGPAPLVAINSYRYWSLSYHVSIYDGGKREDGQHSVQLINRNGSTWDAIEYTAKNSISVIGKKAKEKDVRKVIEFINDFTKEFPSMSKDLMTPLKDLRDKVESIEKSAPIDDNNYHTKHEDLRAKYTTVNNCMFAIAQALGCLDNMLLDFNICLKIIMDHYKIKPKNDKKKK